MKIIISPAKKMSSPQDHDFELTVPRFLDQSESLRSLLQSFSYDELQKIYACSSKTLDPIFAKIQLEKEGVRTPVSLALLSYEGIAFRSMAPNVFDAKQWEYANEHLLILSALYGVLRPLDGIEPYRLEMAQKLPFSLYEKWGSEIADALDDSVIINLASKEYSKAISPYKKLIDVRFFEQDEAGKRKEKGVYAKIARGTMARWMAEHSIEDPKDVKNFDELGYQFDPEASNEWEYVFFRKEQPK